MAAVVLLAMTAVAGSVLNFWNEKNKIHNLAQNALDRGLDAEKHEAWATADIHYVDAAQFAERYSQNAWGRLTRMSTFQELGNVLNGKRSLLEWPRSLEEIKALAWAKSKVAKRHERSRIEADNLFEAADSLRFRLLLGEDKELVQVFEDLQKSLAPFYVLKNEDWTRLNTNLSLLDKSRRERLLSEVNEILFLWIAEIDESLESAPDSRARNHLSPDGDPVGKALTICNKALVWVEPKEPWLAMVEWIKRHQSTREAGPDRRSRSASRCPP